MTVNMMRSITLRGQTFNFAQFVENPEKYLHLFAGIRRASTLIKKDNETEMEYLTRIFLPIYYREQWGGEWHANTGHHISTSARQNRNQSVVDDCYSILNTLGITCVKHNTKTSKLLFKSSGHSRSIKNYHLDALIEAIKKNNKFNRKTLDIRFGVELEFIGTSHYFYGGSTCIRDFSNAMINLVGADRYSCPLSYNHNSGDKWVLGTDGSLRAPSGKQGYELTSPILHLNEKDLNELKQVIGFAERYLHADVNKSCGTHIHMSYDCDKDITIEDLKFFAKSYLNNEEDLFDQCVAKNRRANKSRWCHSVNPDRLNDRYRKLNLYNVFNKVCDNKHTKNMHLEFRQLDGTLDFDKIKAWVKLLRLFVEITANAIGTKYANSSEQMNVIDAISDVTAFDGNDIETLLTMSKVVGKIVA